MNNFKKLLEEQKDEIIKSPIQLYEASVHYLVEQFVNRWYREIYDEEAHITDYDIIWNERVWFWPISMNDGTYLDIDTIYVAEINNIPCKIVQEWYYKQIEKEWDEIWPNLYNYWRLSLNK